MTQRIGLAIGIGILLTAPMLFAQVETLGIASITPTDSLKQSMDKEGKTLSLNRVLESMDSQLLASFNATRKFQIVAASDLKEIIKKQELAQSGNFDASDKSLAQQFKLAGTKYYVITTVDDFQDSTEKMEFKTLNQVGLKRKIHISAVAKVYDSTTGKLLESADIQSEMKDDRSDSTALQKNAELTDALLVSTTKDLSEKIATHVADVIFPVRVVAKRDKQVTINRGDGGGVEIGQVWNVYALGNELIDPDTHESLGKEQVQVGKVKISDIAPKTSIADILEDKGIDTGAILRLPPQIKN